MKSYTREVVTVNKRYEITVAGEPGPTTLAAVPGFEMHPGPVGCTSLVGPVRDQAALQGVLHRLHDLHVELIEVRQLDD